MPNSILIVRLGALGDVVHTTPAATLLKRVWPRARLTWVIEPRWAPLVQEHPAVDEVISLPLGDWRSKPLRPEHWRQALSFFRDLRRRRFDLAIDFQGLLKSAVVARLSGARRVFGFSREQLREPQARRFYTDTVFANRRHVVDQNLALARGVAGRVDDAPAEFWTPQGRPTPATPPPNSFVLASPMAGWLGKQWPPEHYAKLAEQCWRHLRLPLVLDCSPGDRRAVEAIVSQAPRGACQVHVSDLLGLAAATRRARAVVGVDSGPLHLAAAMGKPGVALFGPTDPARNGPYGGEMVTLRAAQAKTSYSRAARIDPAMKALTPGQVFDALRTQLERMQPELVVVAGSAP